jgi:DNA-binding MarR family transcriptional regulator
VKSRPQPTQPGAAFLLAQLGAHAAGRFAERAAELGLTPPQAGILRLVAAEDGLNQRRLAQRLEALPSRVVALLDELEARGLVTRRRSTDDRRSHVLGLTPAGAETLRALGRVAMEHETEITTGLEPAEREQLTVLLQRLADARGLTPGVHPGFRTLR